MDNKTTRKPKAITSLTEQVAQAEVTQVQQTGGVPATFVDGGLDKLTRMVNATLGDKLAEQLTEVDVTAILMLHQINNMQLDITAANTTNALDVICNLAQSADNIVNA